MFAADKIHQFIIDNICDFEGTIDLKYDENIFEAGFVDSSFAMQLIAFIEEQFGLQVPDEDLDLENFSSIDRMVHYIDQKQAQKAS